MSPARSAVVLALALAPAACSDLPRADLVIGNGPEIEAFDPAIVSDSAGLRILSSLFEGLTRIDPETSRPEPALAKRFAVAGDGLAIDFDLREGSLYSDGSPIVAGDLVASWRRVADPATASSWSGLLSAVSGAESIARGEAPPESLGVEARSPTAFRVRLARPDPRLLLAASLPALAPLPEARLARLGDALFVPRNLVSNGHFRLRFFRLRERTRVERNPFHRDAGSIALRTIDFLAADDARTLAAFYFQGDADWVTSVPPELGSRLAGRPDYRSSPLLGTYLLRFNVTRPPLDDANVRRALSRAVDRRAIVERIVRGGETPAETLVPEILPGRGPEIRLAFDPEAARALLAEAGHAGGKGLAPIEIVFNGTEENRAIAEEIQASWRRVLGVEASLRVQEMKVLIGATRRLDYSIARGSWIADVPDALDFLSVFRSGDPNNRTGWASEEYDRLLDRGAAERDPAERAILLARAERLLLDAAPVLPVYHYASRNLVSPALEGFRPNPLDRHPLASLSVTRR